MYFTKYTFRMYVQFLIFFCFFYIVSTSFGDVLVGRRVTRTAVNNVGMQYTYPMYVNEIPDSTVWDLVNVNVGATTHMTKLVLPGMKTRKRGAIVNVSSSAELQPLPLMAVYAATKVMKTIRYRYRCRV